MALVLATVTNSDSIKILWSLHLYIRDAVSSAQAKRVQRKRPSQHLTIRPNQLQKFHGNVGVYADSLLQIVRSILQVNINLKERTRAQGMH